MLPLLGWAVTGDREAYRYLPASIEKFVSLGEFGDVLRAAGFATVEGKPLFPSGVASLAKTLRCSVNCNGSARSA